jgi:hypothetical protein
MKTRKLILIIADVVLLAVCIFQWVRKSHDTTKYFKFTDTPDSIGIITPDENINIKMDDGKWFVGEKKYPANQATVDEFINTLSSIRALNKVGSTSHQSEVERYELNESKATVVTVKKGDKVLRTVTIGKKAINDSQCYGTFDGGKDIYLIAGKLKDIFATNVQKIRSEIVFNLNAEEMTGISITDYSKNGVEGKTVTVSRIVNGEEVSWNVSGSDIQVDSIKAKNFLEGFANLTTSEWYEDDANLEGTKIVSAKIEHATKTTSVEIYEKKMSKSETAQQYFGKSSETPYTFKVNKNSVDKYLKNTDELAK